MDQTAVQPLHFRCGRHRLPLGDKTYLMGIINVTPDSFSDGGLFIESDAAVRQAENLLQAGADILDVGGESTRPGADSVSEEDELKRVLPVIEQLIRRYDCPLSIDTYKPGVAQAALAAGASIVNDVTGLQADARMAQVAADSGAGVIIMHNARLYHQEKDPRGQAITSTMLAFLRHSLALALKAGLAREQLVLDPGIGFGVETAESLAMLRHLPDVKALGLPVLIGPSRKRFIGDVLQVPVEERILGTAAAVAISIAYGADFVRVHDVRQMSAIVKMADAICRSNKGGDLLARRPD